MSFVENGDEIMNPGKRAATGIIISQNSRTHMITIALGGTQWLHRDANQQAVFTKPADCSNHQTDFRHLDKLLCF